MSIGSGRTVRERGGGPGTARGGTSRHGIVYLVGAGPGDPELITLKGARLLGEADAIVHDRLVSPALLDLARPGAALFDAGKEGHGHCIPQSETTALLIQLAHAGLRVVRLKGGDPFVFGRGGEEASALREAGIPFVVVPGVTAGVAGPAYAGIPVTDRRFARSVAFVTAHQGATGETPEFDWDALAKVDTLVVFMAAVRARDVGESLIVAGRAGTTPVAVIRSASLPEQDVDLVDLDTLATEGVAKGSGPTMLVIGPVVELAQELAWFEPWTAGRQEEPADPPQPSDRRTTSARTPTRDRQPAEVAT